MKDFVGWCRLTAAQMSVLSESSDSSSGPASQRTEQEGPDGRGAPPAVELKPAPDGLESAKSAVWPDRVIAALGDASDFGKFREQRQFVFLHLFSGPDDRLAEALVNEGKKAGLNVKVESVDIKKDPAADLRRNEVMDKYEARVASGEFDG